MDGFKLIYFNVKARNELYLLILAATEQRNEINQNTKSNLKV